MNKIELKDLLGLLENPVHSKELKIINYQYDKLPEEIWNLTQLEKLTLSDCPNLNQLSNSIGNLTQLNYLTIDGCVSLTELPESIVKLSQLTYFDIGHH
jgi:Leucine-rich repeat (LRR) protein